MNDLTHLDLFSGIGGFALAARAAGFRTVGFSEVEPYACRVLAEQFSDVPNIGDVRKSERFAVFRRPTVLTGGFPCQPWSLAGKQRGAGDHRHLWPAMCEVISVTGPTWIIGENVPGIISVGLEPVLLDLDRLGYAAQPFVVPACAVDARHRRERVWIVAHARRLDERLQSQPEPQRSDQTVAQNDGSAKPLADAVRGGCATERDVRAGQPDARWERENVADADEQRLQGRDGGGVRECAAQRIVGPRGAPLADSIGVRELQPQGRECAERGWTGDGGRWSPEPGVGRVAHGIPDRAHRLKGLGNAIVPQVAERFFRFIAAIERGQTVS